MNDINNDVERRLRFKTLATIFIGIALSILTGVLLYLLPILYGWDATLCIIGFLAFIIGLISSYFLKTPRFFMVNVVTFSLSPLILGFLNTVSPKYFFIPTTEAYLIGMGFIFFILFSLIQTALMIIMRFCFGYENLYKPAIYSYITDGEFSMRQFRKLLALVGAHSITILGKKQARFDFEGDRYVAYFHQQENQKTELGFMPFRLSRDTIIQPETENVEIFFSLFDACTNKWNAQGKITKLEKESNPHFLQETEKAFITSYASPLRLKVPRIPRPSIKDMFSWSERHQTFIGFLSGIIATIIAGIILWYVFHV